MPDFDLVLAIMAVLRSVPLIAESTGVSGRIYGGRVPPDAAFPRAYVRRDQARRIRAGMSDPGYDRLGRIEVLFACTSAETDDPESWIEQMDTAAEEAIDRQTYAVTGFTYFRRVEEIPIYDQEDSRLTFYVGGGSYEFYREID